MVARRVVSAKLADLASRVGRVRSHRQPTAEALQGEADALDLVSFNLFLAVQVCADIAAHIAVDEEWGAPATLREGFELLHERGVIGSETLTGLKAAVGLRNVVARAYGEVDAEKVHLASHDGLEELARFAREVSSWLRDQPA